MTTAEKLKRAIDEIFAAFADQPRPRDIDGCACCIDRKNIPVLLKKSLRELSPAELSNYAASAFLTVGGVADFLYFLPRILEIAATDHVWYPEPEIVGRAISETRPREWPERRRAAIEHVLRAIVDSAIEERDYEWLEQWMCAIARMGLDVAPYLGVIAASRNAVLGYFLINEKSLRNGRLVNEFWDLPHAGHDAIVAWFRSAEIRAILAEEYGYSM